ncbi:hypothetical protein Tco_0792555 [Tanacetum coccineum]
MHESTTADFKEYNPEYKKEQSDIDHLLGFKCEVMVINDENVNVVCSPGGKIVVLELKNFATVEEIGTVIDHEDKKWKQARYEGKKKDNDVESKQENGGADAVEVGAVKARRDGQENVDVTTLFSRQTKRWHDGNALRIHVTRKLETKSLVGHLIRS